MGYDQLLWDKYKAAMPAIASLVYSSGANIVHVGFNAGVEERFGAKKKEIGDKVVQDKRNEVRMEIMKRARSIEKHFESKGNRTIQGHYAALMMATLFFAYVVTKKFPDLFEKVLSCAKEWQEATGSGVGGKA